MSESFWGVVLATWVLGVISCGSVKNDKPIDAAGGGDATVDAPPDMTAGIVKYDVGYVNELTLSTASDSISGFTLVVNKGTAPLRLSTTSVVTYSDDDPTFTWSFVKAGNSQATLNPERAGGLLSPLATTQIVTNGLVPEPIDDQVLNFEMSITPAPTSGLNLHTQAVVRIDTVDIVLPFTVHFVTGAMTQINSTRRVSSQP